MQPKTEDTILIVGLLLGAYAISKIADKVPDLSGIGSGVTSLTQNNSVLSNAASSTAWYAAIPGAPVQYLINWVRTW